MARKITNANAFTFALMTGGTGGTAKYLALLDSATIGAGNLIDFALLATSVVDFCAYATDDYFYAPAHAFSDGDTVRITGPSKPGGFDGNTLYYVINSVASERFQLSLTSGGGAIDVTTSGGGRIGLSRSVDVTTNSQPEVQAAQASIILEGTDYNADALLNSLFGKTSDYGALASAPSIRLALLTAEPSNSDSGATVSEISYTGYARITSTGGDWNSSAAA